MELSDGFLAYLGAAALGFLGALSTAEYGNCGIVDPLILPISSCTFNSLSGNDGSGGGGSGSGGGNGSGGGKDPYQEAKNGGKHSGFYKTYVSKPSQQLLKSIQSIQKEIAEHKDKIANPQKYIEDWDNLDPRQQNALVTLKWPSDISRQTEQLRILEGILGER